MAALRLDSHQGDTRKVRIVDKEIEWITTAQAAEIMGVSVTNARYLCREGRIECKKWGRAWMVSRADAEAYQRSKRNPDWLHDS